MAFPNKHRHHYVPQGYLRGFTIPGQKSLLWEYDKGKSALPKTPKSVKSICFRTDHNLLIGKDGKPNANVLEDAFNRHVESPALKIIKQLCPRPGLVELSDADRECLSLFISLLLTRNPGFRDGIEELTRRVIDSYLQFNLKEMKKTGEIPQNENMRVVVQHQASVKPMLEVAAMGMKSILAKKWVLYLPVHGTTFVTSDCPAVAGHSGPPSALIGPFHQLSEIFVPLRKDLGLACFPKPPRADGLIDAIGLDKMDVGRFNQMIIDASIRYVYSSDKSQEILRMVKESKGKSQRIIV